MYQNQPASKENSHITGNTGVPNDSEVNDPSEDAVIEKQILPKKGSMKASSNGTYGTNQEESQHTTRNDENTAGPD